MKQQIRCFFIGAAAVIAIAYAVPAIAEYSLLWSVLAGVALSAVMIGSIIKGELWEIKDE